MLERALMHRGTLPSQDFIPEAYPYFSTPDSETGLEQIRNEFQKSLSPRQKQIFSSLNFELTLDQMNSILEMNRDIDKSQTECNTMLNAPQKLSKPPFSMQRLLQGDVGSGKTLVSFFVCIVELCFCTSVGIAIYSIFCSIPHVASAVCKNTM